jgi:CBS domain-containing protein
MSPRAAARLESLGFTQVFDYSAGKMDWAAMGLPTEGKLAGQPRAGDVARKGVPTCHPRERVGEVRERVQTTGWDICVVVGERDVVLGRLRGGTFEKEPEARVQSVMEEGPTTIRPNTELEGITRRMQAKKVSSILVTRSDGRLVGIMYREDAERALET